MKTAEPIDSAVSYVRGADGDACRPIHTNSQFARLNFSMNSDSFVAPSKVIAL